MVRASTSFFEWKWENDFRTYCPWMQYYTAVKIVSAVYVDVVYPREIYESDSGYDGSLVSVRFGMALHFRN